MAIVEVFQHLRRAALLSDGAGLTDGQLLDCYLSRREEAAFEALVRRHGSMVLGVCRRVLRNEQDAEDAFQATFLVFLRKATSILPRERVGNWLYGVAYRTALKARAMRAKRRDKERQVTRREAGEEWQALLDDELNRLPAKYREPVVLCHLQGKTRQEAARQLGWPEGTVATRLATARRLLAKRLAGSLAIAITPVPPLLVVSTVQAATLSAIGRVSVAANVTALTRAVLKGMFMSKVKIVMATLAVSSAIGLGVGTGSYQLLAGEEDRKAPTTDQKAPSKQPTTAQGQLPIGPAPMQALVRLTKDGRLAVTRAITTYKAEFVGNNVVGGKEAVSYRVVNQMQTQVLALSDIEVQDSRGNPIDKARLPQLLREEIPALVYSGAEKLDPLHLRVIKDGLLVFVLPHSDATPVPVPFIAPPAVVPEQPQALESTSELQGRATAVPLKKASALHVAALLKGFFNQRYPQGSAAQKQIRITHEDSTNTIFVQAAPADLEEIRVLIRRIDNTAVNRQSDARAGQIRIVGNAKTADDVILKTIQLFPGQILTAADLKKAEENLKGLKLFDAATVTLLESQSDFKDVLVIVREK